MNVHHLELFYYVAKHRGVSAAARHIPYGIQQPAISAQIIQLEDGLGVTLFHRRPFDLTQAGRDLFDFIEPFFGGLGNMATKLSGGRDVQLRIGAPGAIQHNYLPEVLRGMRQRIPSLVFTLVTGTPAEFEARLLNQEIDVAFTPIHSKPQAGIKCKELARLPLALLAPNSSGIKSADQLWSQDRIETPLISMPQEEPQCLLFQQELQRRKIEWYPSVELDSLDLVVRYAAAGFGVGLVMMQADFQPPAGTRRIPLTGFPLLSYVALWMGTPHPLLRSLLDEAVRIGATFR